jgi:hypothetical protein
MMKRTMGVLGCTLCLAVGAHAQIGGNNAQVVNNGNVAGPITNVGGSIGSGNTFGTQNTNFGQNNVVRNSPVNNNSVSVAGSNAYGGSGGQGGTGYGGTGYGYGGAGGVSDSSSSSSVNVNYEQRTGIVHPQSPYLPYWDHAGWGLSEAYFANGPTADQSVYERSYNPRDPEDMEQLRRTLKAVPNKGFLSIIPGIFNQISVVFGGVDKYHHGRGFQISNSLVRNRRPTGKPLMVLYSNDIDRRVFKKADYAYVGKVSVEGHQDRNWDQIYYATMAEVLPWDVDILIIDGGMKGVSVGTNSSTSGGAGFSQANYSVSLMGGVSRGITEAKGKPVISAEAFRYSPRLRFKRSISRQFYSSLKSRYPELQQARPVTYSNPTGGTQGIQVRPEILDMAGFAPGQQVDCMSVPEVHR